MRWSGLAIGFFVLALGGAVPVNSVAISKPNLVVCSRGRTIGVDIRIQRSELGSTKHHLVGLVQWWALGRLYTEEQFTEISKLRRDGKLIFRGQNFKLSMTVIGSTTGFSSNRLRYRGVFRGRSGIMFGYDSDQSPRGGTRKSFRCNN